MKTYVYQIRSYSSQVCWHFKETAWVMNLSY